MNNIAASIINTPATMNILIKFIFAALLVLLTTIFTLVHAESKAQVMVTNEIVNAYKQDDGKTYLDSIKKQLKTKREIVTNEEKSALLVLAVMGGKISVTTALLEWGASPNAPGVINFCSEARKAALSEKDAWQCEALIGDKGLLEVTKLTPLQAACVSADMTIMKMLLSKGAKAAPTSSELDPLGACIVNKKFAMAEILIDAGAVVDGSANGLAPLMDLAWASADESDQAAAKQLALKMLDKGANPKYVARGGFSVLHSSAAAGNLAIVKLLIERGADINLKTAKGMTPLAHAEKSKKEVVIDFLLSKGASN
jgi:Ankyrin repeats (many copies)